MSLKTYFAKTLTTSDDNPDVNLKPHYYANDYQTVKKRVLEVANFLKIKVASINDNYQEILLVKSNNCDIVVTIFRAGSAGCRVDLHVNIETGIAFGTCQNTIKEFYKLLDQKLTRKGN